MNNMKEIYLSKFIMFTSSHKKLIVSDEMIN